jgi:hypothetical protein
MKTKFFRESPPRHVDVFSQAVLLLSGFKQQMGWGFFAFGMLFFWIFGMQSTVTKIFSPLGETREVQGQVVQSEGTNAYENEAQVFRYTFTYIDEYREYEGTSYGFRFYEAGSTVPVTYSVKHPERAYITGSRRSVFSAWVLFVVLFPAIGLAMILVDFIRNRQYLRLLKVGQATTGVMKKKEATGSTVTINDQKYPVYKYTFQFEVGGKTFESMAKTHRTQRLEDESREIILYDHFNPAHNVLFDSVAISPRIDEAGYLVPASPWRIVVFLLPLLAVLVNILGYQISIAIGL